MEYARLHAGIGLNNKDRIRAAIGTAALEAIIGYALFAGFWNKPSQEMTEPIKLFRIAEPSPPEAPVTMPARERTPNPEGAASLPNLKSVATEITAPPPPAPQIFAPTVVTAPDPSVGTDWTSGAADLPGPGTGSGGFGTGTGSGRGGLGDGGGGGRGRGSPPRRLKGRLSDSDYPPAAWKAGAGGTVSVIFAVETNGRVSECEVIETSGHVALDENTCRLIVRRYRFDPARDSEGRPVRSRVTENHSWVIQQEPPPK